MMPNITNPTLVVFTLSSPQASRNSDLTVAAWYKEDIENRMKGDEVPTARLLW